MKLFVLLALLAAPLCGPVYSQVTIFPAPAAVGYTCPSGQALTSITKSGFGCTPVSAGAGIAIACVGNPGATVGPYLSQCQTSAGLRYSCNNAAGCTTSGDWVGLLSSYPAAGIANSTGSAWTTPYTTNGTGTALCLTVGCAIGLANGLGLPATGLASISADNIVGNFSASGAVPGTQVVPACANDGVHGLVYVAHVLTCASITGSGALSYPGAGIPNSTGSAWGTSYTSSGTGTALCLTVACSIGLANGTGLPVAGLASISADNIVGNFSGSGAVPGTQVVPACANDGLHGLVYVAHVLTCASITGSATVGYPGAGVPASTGAAWTSSYAVSGAGGTLCLTVACALDLTNGTGLPAAGLAQVPADNIFGNFSAAPATTMTQALPACPADGAHGLTYVAHVLTCTSIAGTTTYPGAGIANSTGSAWTTPYTTNGTGTALCLTVGCAITAPTLTNPTINGALLTGTVGDLVSFGASNGTSNAPADAGFLASNVITQAIMNGGAPGPLPASLTTLATTSAIQAGGSVFANYGGNTGGCLSTSNPGMISASTLNNGGSGYVAGNTFTIAGSTTPATGTVLTVSGGAVVTYTLSGVGDTWGTGYTATATAAATTATSGVGINLTINITGFTSYSNPWCAPSYGYNQTWNMWSSAGADGNYSTSDGAGNLLWSSYWTMPHLTGLITYAPPAATLLTASTEVIDLNVNLARSVQFATGTLAVQRAALFQAPTYSFVGASTLTATGTLVSSGPPIAGTNGTLTHSAAVWGQSAVLTTTNNVNGYGGRFDSPTGAVHNYALYANGNMLVGNTAFSAGCIGVTLCIMNNTGSGNTTVQIQAATASPSANLLAIANSSAVVLASVDKNFNFSAPVLTGTIGAAQPTFTCTTGTQTGVGTTGSATCPVNLQGTDVSGLIHLTTGTGSPATSSPAIVVAFGNTHTTAPGICLTGLLASASGLQTYVPQAVEATVTGFTIYSGTTALSIGTSYYVWYLCM